MGKFFVVLIGGAIAILILKYRGKIKELLGDIPFAEKYLGPGGTNTLIIIIAFFTFVGSLMWAAGTLQKILGSILGPFF